jgi:hypothetical protein
MTSAAGASLGKLTHGWALGSADRLNLSAYGQSWPNFDVPYRPIRALPTGTRRARDRLLPAGYRSVEWRHTGSVRFDLWSLPEALGFSGGGWVGGSPEEEVASPTTAADPVYVAVEPLRNGGPGPFDDNRC